LTGDRGECARIMGIKDQAADLVHIGIDDRLIQKRPKRHLGQRPFRGHALPLARGGDASQRIAGLLLVGLRQQVT
jgi:hypothetical protein